MIRIIKNHKSTVMCAKYFSGIYSLHIYMPLKIWLLERPRETVKLLPDLPMASGPGTRQHAMKVLLRSQVVVSRKVVSTSPREESSPRRRWTGKRKSTQPLAACCSLRAQQILGEKMPLTLNQTSPFPKPNKLASFPIRESKRKKITKDLSHRKYKKNFK